MGTYLTKPKTEKVSEDGENHRVRYGLSSMQGWRSSMEDAVSRNHWISYNQRNVFVYGLDIC